MFEHLQKIHWKKVLIAGVVFLVIATITRQIEVFLTMDFYKDPQFFGVWSRLMMPANGPPPLQFILYSFLFTYLTGITLAFLYDFIKGNLSKKFWLKVGSFTDITVGLSFVFFTLPSFLLFNIPLILLIYWLISTTVIIFLSTIFFVKYLK